MFLNRIVDTKLEEVAQLKSTTTVAKLEQEIASLPACRGFIKALRESKNRSMGLIAEVKKASPSKGLIREDFAPDVLAAAYERAGADCISVLTDGPYFQGANEYLQLVKSTVNVPLLRKDFTIDPIQIYEARAIGADAILLIAAILTKEQMRDYLQLASELGMDTLVEVHDRKELETVLELDATLIGVNNRNLHTFVTDIGTTEQLMDMMPKHATIVSESGIAGANDIQYLQGIGAHAVLVGEHLMRQPDVELAVHELMGPLPTEQEA